MATEEKDKKDDDLVMVGDGAPETETKDADDEKDKGKKDDDADDDPDSTDSSEKEERTEDRRAGAAEEEPDERGDSRWPKRSSAEKNALRRRSRDRDRTELRYLRARNEKVEQQLNGMAKEINTLKTTTVDTKIGQIKSTIKRARETFARASAAGEEAAALEASNLQAQLEDQLDKETKKREEVAKAAVVAPNQDDSGIPPAVQRNVEAWMDRNEWFDPDGKDRMSRMARIIDAEVLNDNFDPNDPEYYREVDRRLRESLPELRKGKGKDEDRREGRDEDDDVEDRTERKSGKDKDRGSDKPRGPRFRVGGRERALGKNEVYVTSERRKALEDMGAWEDPVLRKKYLKSFKKWDDEAAAQADRR